MISKSAVFFLILMCFEPITCACTRDDDKRVTCLSISFLSGTYINETLKNVGSITILSIINKGEPLYLTPNTFESLTNLKIIEIISSKIPTIHGGTFKNLPLNRIYLRNCGISKIEPKTFQNLNNVELIQLSYNELKSIKKDVFVDMPVVTLTLSDNLISEIEDRAFKNLTKLERFHLDNNRLTFIYPHKFLSNPEVLDFLSLRDNSLKLISIKMLEKLTNLKVLNLGFNKIDTIEENAFAQTPNLVTLVLSRNNLKEIDGTIVPRTGMGSLQRLYLDYNKLMYISSNLLFRMVRLRRIALMNNPWFCKCLEIVQKMLMENSIVEECNDMFVSGYKPLCVVDRVESCRYVYDQELSDEYFACQETNRTYLGCFIF